MMKRTNFWTLATLVGVVGGGGWAAKSTGAFEAEEVAVVEGAKVQKGPLRISVVERGNLSAADSVNLKSEIEGRTTVLWLIKEGTEVKEGDLVCELDTKSLVDNRVQQEIDVQNAFASYTKAKQNFEIQKSQNESDIARAQQDVEFAELDYQKYIEGDEPQLRQEAEESIQLRDEELKRAQQDLDWSEKLAEKGFLEQTQLDADRLAESRATIALNQAQRSLELLDKYQIPRDKKALLADIDEARREKSRVELQAAARLTDFEADLQTSKAKYELERSELEKMNEQIEKAKIYTPVSGMVVYAMEETHRWGGGEPMQEGAEVRERQEIITIPSDKGYVAEASLHESVLEKVTTGMPCFITVDALQKTLRGEVTYKAVLPDQQSFFANPDLRVYRTEVHILDEDKRMRPGMSCSIEILVEDLPDATYVPVQSVFLDAGRPIALVKDGPTVEKRSIEVGPNNGKWVSIHSGLEAGETVLLSQPSNVTLEPAPDDVDFTDREGWPESLEARPATAEVQEGNTHGEEGAARPSAFGNLGGNEEERAARMEQFRKDNPEAAKRFEEMMKDPEKMREMRERFQQGGGGERRGDAENP